MLLSTSTAVLPPISYRSTSWASFPHQRSPSTSRDPFQPLGLPFIFGVSFPRYLSISSFLSNYRAVGLPLRLPCNLQGSPATSGRSFNLYGSLSDYRDTFPNLKLSSHLQGFLSISRPSFPNLTLPFHLYCSGFPSMSKAVFPLRVLLRFHSYRFLSYSRAPFSPLVPCLL